MPGRPGRHVGEWQLARIPRGAGPHGPHAEGGQPGEPHDVPGVVAGCPFPNDISGPGQKPRQDETHTLWSARPPGAGQPAIHRLRPPLLGTLPRAARTSPASPGPSRSSTLRGDDPGGNGHGNRNGNGQGHGQGQGHGHGHGQGYVPGSGLRIGGTITCKLRQSCGHLANISSTAIGSIRALPQPWRLALTLTLTRSPDPDPDT